MQIYDCFPFYNELDILELRLTELSDFVDHFVLVEADTTYTSRPKPFYFEENRDRFAPWLDKIIHVKVTDMPHHPDAWVNDVFQRDQINRGIANAKPDDLIMVSDCDEIIRPEAIEYMKNSDQSLFALRMTLHNFKFNYMKLNPDRYSVWSMAGRRSLFDDIRADAFRALRFQFFNSPYQFCNNGCEVIEHGGWHFGYMGDKEWLLDKAVSFAHTEVNTPEFLAQIDPEASIAARTEWNQTSDARYEIVELDEYFPRTIVNNQERYKKYILDNPVAKAIDLLPAYPYNS
jgi:glycosyltransferase involved in cell wall biosynthesis